MNVAVGVWVSMTVLSLSEVYTHGGYSGRPYALSRPCVVRLSRVLGQGCPPRGGRRGGGGSGVREHAPLAAHVSYRAGLRVRDESLRQDGVRDGHRLGSAVPWLPL